MLSYTVEPSTPRARLDYWNRAMREVFRAPWNVMPERPTEFHMRMKAVSLSNTVLSQATLSQTRLCNSPDPAGDKGEHPYSIYTVNQPQQVVIRGSSFTLNPGDFTLVDSTLSSRMNTSLPYTTIGLTVPESTLRNFLPSPDQAVGVRFSGSKGLSATVSRMLVSMWELAEKGALTELGDKLSTSLLELFSACCYLDCPQPVNSGTGGEERRRQIKRFIDNSLRNPDLSVEEVARKMGFSSRYMQMLFAQENNTISRYIRQQRLHGCRQQLADPLWKDRSITEIAFSWGFNNSAHFAKVFREEFGISASELRKQAFKRMDALSWHKQN